MSIFRFQQFSVQQNSSGMKVCTDATLFGAMAPINGGERVLDIGTGTGLLALITAQLGASHITGVELTREAFDEACINFRNSPWSGRLTAVHGSIQDFQADTQGGYDLIIANPPFYESHSKAADHLRRQARHADLLPFADLLDCVDRLLGDGGLFYLILPKNAATGFVQMALERRFYLIEQTDFRGRSDLRSKVSALTFSRESQVCQPRTLTIYQSERVYSKESEQYLSPFLLRFARNN